MNSSKVAKQERRFSKKPPLFIFSLFIFALIASSVGAVSVEVSNFRFQDSAVVSERYYAVNVKVSATGQEEKGIIELGLSKDSSVPFLAYFSSESPCVATFPWNTHAFYHVGIVGSFDSVSFTLIGRGMPDGTFYPVITHATGCFTGTAEQQALQAKEPYGFGKRITSNAIVFGQSLANANDQCDNPWEALQWVKAKDDVACVEAVCDNAASTSSTARCVRRAECGEGAQQWTTCADGSSISVRACVNGFWSESGNVCPGGQPLPPKPAPVKAGIGGGGAGVLGVLGLVAAILTIGSVLFVLLRKSGLLRF